MKHPHIRIGKRLIGPDYAPFVVPEIGINHEGSIVKAKRMIRDAAAAGAECVKFQAHVIDDEMIPEAKKVIPGNAKESIWHIMNRCALSEKADRELQAYTKMHDLIYFSTPFSRAAADRLQRMRVPVYKIGSGECNNYPLIDHIASFGKPIILSTGMNDIRSIRKSVAILRKRKIPFALMHCVSMYPTPYNRVHLGALRDLRKAFPDAVLGLSDHSIGTYTSFAAITLGASIVEKHFTSDITWPGPDVPISITPDELHELVIGSSAISSALGGKKQILREEKPTIDFAYASVVTTAPIKPGERFTRGNLWVKRPGTGEILAEHYQRIISKKSRNSIPANVYLKWNDII